MEASDAVGAVPDNANAHCPGTGAEEAGKAAACAGCPNQQICATAPKGPDPDVSAISHRLSSVKHVLLVLSGKGGVGKSTFAAQLAWALALKDKQVGLLDIDICGPSIPRLMGLEGAEVHQSASGWSPVYVDDRLGVMSIGFMLSNPNEAVVWRGPRKNSLIKQFLLDVDWGDLDFLVIDSPPGTSDEHISVAQYLKGAHVDGAIVVTTPQEVSLIDVRKELSFCSKVGIPVIGVVENMAKLQVPVSSVRFLHQSQHTATSASGSPHTDMQARTQAHEGAVASASAGAAAAMADPSAAVHGHGMAVDVTARVMEALQKALPDLFPTSSSSTSSNSIAPSPSLLLSTPMFHVPPLGGGEAMAREMGVPFLGSVPFDPQLGRAAEEGRAAGTLAAAAPSDGSKMDTGDANGVAGRGEVQGELSPACYALQRIFDKILAVVEKE